VGRCLPAATLHLWIQRVAGACQSVQAGGTTNIRLPALKHYCRQAPHGACAAHTTCNVSEIFCALGRRLRDPDFTVIRAIIDLSVEKYLTPAELPP